MGKQKGDALITRAQNILFNQYVHDIAIGEETVEISLQKNNEGITKSVLTVVSAYSAEKLDIEKNDCLIIIRKKPRESPPLDIEEWRRNQFEREQEEKVNVFNRVLSEARKQKMFLEEEKQQELEKQGIEHDEEEIKSFARTRGFEGFYKEVFRAIVGNEPLKIALTTSLFSSFYEPVHVLVIGDPGSSKTLARDIIVQSFGNVYSVGAVSTRAGLVCNLTNGSPGALILADQNIVLVDEFDKIDDAQIEPCCELLSNARCSVHSARIHEEFESHFTLIGFGNPATKVFSSSAMDSIGINPVLMSRFALIVRATQLEKDDRLILFRAKLEDDLQEGPTNPMFDQWVRLAKTHQPQKKFSSDAANEYVQFIDTLFEQYQDSSLRRDLRMGDYGRRVPSAIARAEFSDITDETLRKARWVFEIVINDW